MQQVMQKSEPPLTRADPAPSRFRYRMARLMLTPAFRLLLRVGLPMAATFGLTLWYLSDEGRRDAIVLGIADMRAAIEERPEFMVGLMAIDGASDAVAEDIRDIVPIDFPVSSFDLDLDAIRARVAGLDAVERASVRIRPGGLLQVDVTERVPVVIWRGPEGLELLDAGGVRVAPLAARNQRPDLPVIAGEGAQGRVAEARALLAAAEPLQNRVRGLVFVGERRWDVVLTDGPRILLPVEAPVPALERVIAMHYAHDLLSRDLAVVDLRDPARPTLRMTENAVRELARIRQTAAGEN